MIDRARVRCPDCRTAVPVTVLWASGDICPTCGTHLDTPRHRATGDGVMDKVRGLLKSQTPAKPRGGRGDGLLRTRPGP